jgi:hypothetical protein
MKSVVPYVIAGSLFLIIVILIGILAFVPAPKKNGSTSVPTISSTRTEKDVAIEMALKLYTEKKATGINMENGPCLSEEIIPDWVVDIAHNPRLSVDDIAANQCQSYRGGKTHHFVEIDPQGTFIRAL